MTDVSFCEDGVGMNEKNAFLWVSEFERLTTPPPGSPHIPQRWGQLPATAQQDRPAHPEAVELGRLQPDAQGGNADRPRRIDRADCTPLDALAACPKLSRYGQHNFTVFFQKNKSEKSYSFFQKGLTYKIYLI